MSQGTIVAIVLAIVIFGILALGVNSYASILKTGTSSSICKASAVARAAYFDQTAALRALFKNVPKLDCKTDYTCLSLGSDCQKGYETKKVDSADKIRSEVADKLLNCYDQLGSGKINFAGSDFISKNVCVICSQIKFDETARNKVGALDNMNQYLSSTKASTQNATYSQYISKNTLLVVSNRIDLSKEQAIIYGINTPSYWKNALTSGGAAGALGIKGAAVGTLFCGPVCGAGGLLIGGTAGAIGGDALIKYIEGPGVNKPTYSLSLIEYNPEELAKNCEIRLSTA